MKARSVSVQFPASRGISNPITYTDTEAENPSQDTESTSV